MLQRLNGLHFRPYSTRVPFDTGEFVKILERATFSPTRAEAIGRVYAQNLTILMDQIHEETTKKSDFIRAMHSKEAELFRLKNDVKMTQTQDLLQAKSAFDQITRDFSLGRQRVWESLGTLRSELRLDYSVQKAKLRDSALARALRFQDVRAKIDTEWSNSKASMDKIRFEVYCTMVGFFVTATAALVGYLRFFNQ